MKRKRGMLVGMKTKLKPRSSEYKLEISKGGFPEYLASPDESEYRKFNPSWNLTFMERGR